MNVTGKILNDDTQLKDYKIDEKNFVVVMVTKVSVSLFRVFFFKNRTSFVAQMRVCFCEQFLKIDIEKFRYKQNWTNSAVTRKGLRKQVAVKN